jgi:hypothetical protein
MFASTDRGGRGTISGPAALTAFSNPRHSCSTQLPRIALAALGRDYNSARNGLINNSGGCAIKRLGSHIEGFAHKAGHLVIEQAAVGP